MYGFYGVLLGIPIAGLMIGSFLIIEKMTKVKEP